jgi:DNA-binding response OmpR family regulator
MDATILVIEESLDLCRLFEYLLRADGYIVSSFHDWQSAQAALVTHDPDLIIFDWSLNNTSGYGWAETVRRSNKTAHIPVLLVCGDQPPRATLETIGQAGISVIDKPFDIFIFRNRISALLGARERVAGSGYA